MTTLDAKRFTELVERLKAGTLTSAAGKGVLAEMVATGKRVQEIALPEVAAVDVGSAVDAVIAANPDKAAQYKAGKTGLLGFFVGQVMRSAPNADAGAVHRVLRERLG